MKIKEIFCYKLNVLTLNITNIKFDSIAKNYYKYKINGSEYNEYNKLKIEREREKTNPQKQLLKLEKNMCVVSIEIGSFMKEKLY